MKTRVPGDTKARDPARKQRLRFSRRALLVGAGQAGLFGLLAWRLRELQILDSSQYRLLADENRLSRQLTAPRRGAIYDRFGTPVAESRESLRVTVVPAFAKGLGRTLDALSRIVPIPATDRDRVLRTARRQSSYRPVVVVEGLSWRQFALLNVLAPQLPGVATDVGSFRIYNSPEPMAHVVGYVGMAGKGEVDEDPVMRVPGFRLGKTGVEKGFDRWLRGYAGNVTSEVDAHGRIVRELGSTPSVPGRDLVLTIDHELQAIAYNRIASERRGSLVALDCTTGDVLVMVSMPSFDPNEVAFKPTPSNGRRCQAAPTSRSIIARSTGQYPPGSTFKVVNALAGLTAGVVTPEERIVCRGGYFFGNHFFHCWKSHGADRAARRHQVVLRRLFLRDGSPLGIDKLAVTGRALGLGKAYDRELAGAEEPASCPTPPGSAPHSGSLGIPARPSVAGSGRAMCWRRRFTLRLLRAGSRPAKRSCRASCARVRAPQPISPNHSPSIPCISSSSATAWRGGERERRHRHPLRAQAFPAC